jgi:hypothetical protein
VEPIDAGLFVEGSDTDIEDVAGLMDWTSMTPKAAGFYAGLS